MSSRHCLHTIQLQTWPKISMYILIENHFFFLIWLKIQMYLVHRGTNMLRFFKISSIGHWSNFYWHIFETVEIHLCAGVGLTKKRSFIFCQSFGLNILTELGSDERQLCAGGGLTKKRSFILSSCHQMLSLGDVLANDNSADKPQITQTKQEFWPNQIGSKGIFVQAVA